MLNEDQRRFLAGRRVGHLATADAAAPPHVVPVCFAVARDALYITIDQKPKGDPRALKRLRNIAGNPSVALVADRYDEDWTRLGWVMLRGRAEILEAGARARRGPGAVARALSAISRHAARRAAGHRHSHRTGDELGRSFRRSLTVLGVKLGLGAVLADER